MTTSELLAQFIAEARECLEQVGARLLDVERSPDDPALLNDLFRLVHTLKGNCGLFDFKDLERVVHAGEDVLDQVRRQRLAYSSAVTDALLDAMDYASEQIDAIARTGALNRGTLDRSQAIAQNLRSLLGGPVASAAPVPVPALVAAPPTPATAPAAWLDEVPADWRQPGRVIARYWPERECFFKGEDPWGLVTQTPGLVQLQAVPQQPWPAADAFDCYQCNLAFTFASDSPLAYVQDHFRCVAEQLDLQVIEERPEPARLAAAPERGQALVRQRISQLWQEQLGVLSVPDAGAASVRAARRCMVHLLECWGGESADEGRRALVRLPDGATPLATWATTALPVAEAAPRAAAHPADHAAGDATVNAGAPMSLERRNKPGGLLAEDPNAASVPVLKVGQDKVDRLMDLIGEMVVAKNALPYLAQRAEDHFGQRELSREIKAQYGVINRIAEDMQHAIMQVRMLPVGTVFQRFGRLVRDLSKKLGKDVQLVIEGEDTEADKNVIESLADPLIHILRNSLDHGLEAPEVRVAAGKPAQGILRVSARQEGDRVLLDISDDGAGVDTQRVRLKAVERGLIPADRADQLSEQEAVQLVFLPGFSTADTISDLSGRGVGMDVVRSAVERVNGSVELSSVRGQGTSLRLTLPLSMAVTNVMMIETAGRRFGIPMDLIVETVRLPAEDIHHFKRAMTVVLRGRIVPLRSLHELLSLGASPLLNDAGEHAVLVIRHGHDNVGLMVDNFEGTSDIILKPLEGVLAGIIGFAGTALMGDGSVLMILNPKELL